MSSCQEIDESFDQHFDVLKKLQTHVALNNTYPADYSRSKPDEDYEYTYLFLTKQIYS